MGKIGMLLCQINCEERLNDCVKHEEDKIRVCMGAGRRLRASGSMRKG